MHENKDPQINTDEVDNRIKKIYSNETIASLKIANIFLIAHLISSYIMPLLVYDDFEFGYSIYFELIITAFAQILMVISYKTLSSKYTVCRVCIIILFFLIVELCLCNIYDTIININISLSQERVYGHSFILIDAIKDIIFYNRILFEYPYTYTIDYRILTIFWLGRLIYFIIEAYISICKLIGNSKFFVPKYDFYDTH